MSAWAARRTAKSVHISGMTTGDGVLLSFKWNGGDSHIEVSEDGIFIIPDQATHVRAKHATVSGESRVSVLLR